jgi:hypothetical protein
MKATQKSVFLWACFDRPFYRRKTEPSTFPAISFRAGKEPSANRAPVVIQTQKKADGSAGSVPRMDVFYENLIFYYYFNILI